MSVVKIGSSTLVQGPTVSKGDPYTGVTTSTSYEGTEAAVRAQFIFLFNQGWTCEMTTRTATTGENYATLNASKADDFVLPPVIWEINGVKVNRNILECSELPFVAG